MKLTKEQSRAIRCVLKARYKDGGKLAYLSSGVWHLDDEDDTTLWICDMAHVIGSGLYLISSFQQDMNNGGIEKNAIALDKKVIERLFEKEVPYLKAREKRRKEVFGE